MEELGRWGKKRHDLEKQLKNKKEQQQQQQEWKVKKIIEFSLEVS